MVISRSRVRGRILATSLMLGIGFALAAPGDLDTGFGDSGLLSLKFSIRACSHGGTRTVRWQIDRGRAWRCGSRQ